MPVNLNDKNADIPVIAEKALKDRKLLAELLDGLKVKTETYRYNCHKALVVISENHGQVLYPYWDMFAVSLDSVNSYHKTTAVHLLADLTAVDKENKFEKIFDKYYSLLDDKSMVVAFYTARNSGKIVKAKPELATKITNRLLDIDKTHHNASRKGLIKAGIIEAFGEYYEDYPGKAAMLDFVKEQVKSQSARTRNAAKAFLKKREND
jgi:hypothetical protein